MSKIRYKYKSVAISSTPIKYDLMPIIPITISYGGQEMNVEALIDSGASLCFCPVEIGQALGIPWKQCYKNSLTGVGGTAQILIHKLDVGIEYDKFKFTADVGFGKFNFHGHSFVLGQKNFFENVDIIFERRKKRVELHLPK